MLKAQNIQDTYAVQPANLETRKISDGLFGIHVGAIQNNKSTFNFEFLKNLRGFFVLGSLNSNVAYDPEAAFRVAQKPQTPQALRRIFLRQNDS
jgi:hypothetical protein